MFSPEDFIFC